MRGWSYFVKFSLVMTGVMVIVTLVLHGDLYRALDVGLLGAAMLVSGEFVAPVLAAAISSYAHDRAGVPARCGDPVAPTATDWHRAIVSVVSLYLLAVTVGGLANQRVSSTLLLNSVLFMLPWIGLMLGVHLVAEIFHFLGHRRAYRHDLRVREQIRREQEDTDTTRRFWDVVRGVKPDPGSTA